MSMFIQVSASEFYDKCNPNRPFVRTIEAGKNVMNFYNNEKIVGKIVEIREKSRGVYKFEVFPKFQVKKEFYLAK